MTKTMHSIQFSAAVLLLSVGIAPAQALDLARTDVQGASGMCKPATAAFASVVRHRPLGLSNESGAPIFVTCNWQGDDSTNTVRGAKRVFVVVSNDGAEPAALACTLVNGFQQGASLQATYTPKTATIAPGQAVTMEWLPSELPNAPTRIAIAAVSCAMPGATTLNFTGKEYDENVGA